MIFSHIFCLILGSRKSIIYDLTETSSNKTPTRGGGGGGQLPVKAKYTYASPVYRSNR